LGFSSFCLTHFFYWCKRSIESTTIQQLEKVESTEKAQTIDEERDTGDKDFIQHAPIEEGERGGVGQTQSDDVLQTPPEEGNKSEKHSPNVYPRMG
jgi:hypothetical protein